MSNFKELSLSTRMNFKSPQYQVTKGCICYHANVKNIQDNNNNLETHIKIFKMCIGVKHTNIRMNEWEEKGLMLSLYL